MSSRKLTGRQLLAVGAWLALGCFYLFFMMRNRGMELDDALIYLRYIENAIAGRGLVYNDGVYFNGLTSPLFSYLVLVLALLLGNASLASFLVSGFLYFSAALVTAILFTDAASRKGMRFSFVAGFAGALIFLSLPFFFLFYGMETGLLALLSGLFLWLMRHRRYEWAGIVAALLFLTRSEGALLVLVAGIYDLVKYRSLPKFRAATYVIPVVLVGAVYAFNYFYYGSLTPQTAMAKIWQGTSGLWAGAEFWEAGYLYQWVFKRDPLVLGVLLGFAGIGFLALGKDYLNVVIVAYLVLYAAFYSILLIPNYGWYYSPFFAFGAFYAGYGFAWLVSLVGARLSSQDPFALAWVALATLPLLGVLGFFADMNRHERGGYVPYRDIGYWLNEKTGHDESVAMVEIGTVGYYSERPVIDVLGLVNPENARFIGERRFDAWLDVYQPDYILVHDPLWDHELSLIEAGSRWSLSESCEFSRPLYRLFRVDPNGGPGIVSCPDKNAYFPGLVAAGIPTVSTSLGHVDTARVAGNYLVLDGWVRSPAGGAYEALGYSGPPASSVMWQRQPRQDVADHFSDQRLATAGFKVIVRFEDHDQALSARQHGCLLVSAGSGSAALPLVDGNGCAQGDGALALVSGP